MLRLLKLHKKKYVLQSKLSTKKAIATYEQWNSFEAEAVVVFVIIRLYVLLLVDQQIIN